MEHSICNHVESMSAEGSARIQIGNNSTINHTTNNYSQDDDNKYLAALSLTDPRQDKSRIEQTNGGLLKESYLWVLQNPEFQRWREASKSQPLLWVRGDPGKGKTMLLSGIIDELQPSTRLKDPTSHTSLSFFFCQATLPGLNNATAVLRGLVYLLVDQNPSLISHMRGKLSLDPGHWNSGVTIRALFLEMLQDLSLQNVVLIVDALDECEMDMRYLLGIITATMSHQVKWLVSSRNIRMIEMVLTQAQTKLVLSLELNAKSVAEAISEYIQHRLERLSSRINLDDDELRLTSSYLYDNAHGTFLWVALVCQQLEACNEWEVSDLLRRSPQGLNALYEEMMKRVRKSTSANLYTKILAIVFAAYRPIMFSELAVIGDLRRHKNMVPKMIMECGGFLTSRDGVIYLVHQSARDFLAKQHHKLFSHGLTQHHLRVFDTCLNSLDGLKMDMYDQVYPGVSVDEARCNRPSPDPLSGLSYACEFWAHHLRDAQPILAQDILHYDKAHKFIADKFLFWLEALSLCWNLSSAMETIQILKGLPLSDEAMVLVEDARLFFLLFRSAINEYPLQTYASGLLFSPEQSLIRSLFEYCSPRFVVKKPHVDAQWRPYLSILEWHATTAFSPDNKSLVTAKFGEVKKWKVSDGMEDMRINCDGLRFITLSPDLKWFAGTTCEQPALQVRDLESNTVKWSKPLDNRKVESMKFSHDSQWLAVCFDKELELWEVEKISFKSWPLGISFSILRGIEFSLDGALVAIFGMPRRGFESIVVLDTQTDEQHKNPNAEIDVLSAVFSPSTYELMMCSGGNVWSWDVTGGKCEQWLRFDGHAHFIASSHDASWIAVASDSTVFLYGKQSQKLLQTLEIPSSRKISSIDISFDNKRLAASSHEAVCLWDISSSMSKETHCERVAAKKVFVSGNGRLMAWAIEGKIQVWDATTGNPLAEFNMPRPWSTDTLATFSSHGHLLVSSSSSSSSSSLFIWDLIRRKLLQGIKVTGSISQLAVSHDASGCGRLIAAITEKKIHVWDSTTMRQQWSLPYISENIPIALQFSHDKLAVVWPVAGHDGCYLIYYDVANGTRLTHVKLSRYEYPYGEISVSPSGHRAAWMSYREFPPRAILISQEEGGLRKASLIMDTLRRPHFSFLDDSTVLTVQGRFDIGSILAKAAVKPNTPHEETEETEETEEIPTFDPDYVGYGYSEQDDWITLDGSRLLWLPLQYRLKYRDTGFAVGEHHFAMHSSSGVFFIQFSQEARELISQTRHNVAT